MPPPCRHAQRSFRSTSPTKSMPSSPTLRTGCTTSQPSSWLSSPPRPAGPAATPHRAATTSRLLKASRPSWGGPRGGARCWRLLRSCRRRRRGTCGQQRGRARAGGERWQGRRMRATSQQPPWPLACARPVRRPPRSSSRGWHPRVRTSGPCCTGPPWGLRIRTGLPADPLWRRVHSRHSRPPTYLQHSKVRPLVSGLC